MGYMDAFSPFGGGGALQGMQDFGANPLGNGAFSYMNNPALAGMRNFGARPGLEHGRMNFGNMGEVTNGQPFAPQRPPPMRAPTQPAPPKPQPPPMRSPEPVTWMGQYQGGIGSGPLGQRFMQSNNGGQSFMQAPQGNQAPGWAVSSNDPDGQTWRKG